VEAAAARVVAGWVGRDDSAGARTLTTALRACVRELRADGPFAGFDEVLDEVLEDALEGDAPSLSADAVAMPSEVPTPRKIASAPTLPMYLEYPTGAFSVWVDCCIAASYGMDDRVATTDVAGITDGTARVTRH
jgi:hypothetical protein